MIDVGDLRVHTRARSSEDAYLTALELSAVAYVEKQTGRFFGVAAATTEYIVGSGGVNLWLKEEPAASPTPVVKERVVPGGTATTITAADASGYLIRGMKLVRKAGLGWARGYEYEVAYTRGYASGAEPADIRHLVTIVVAHWYERRIPVPKVGETFTFPVPQHAESIIQAWRRNPV